MTMRNEFFYTSVERNSQNSDFIEMVNKFSEETNTQVYILDKPLGEKKYNYDYTESLVLLIPKYKIIFINFNKDTTDDFKLFIEDFIDDLGYISDKYEYKKLLGRPRHWNKYFDSINYEDITCDLYDVIKNNKLEDKKDQRICEIMISLLTGSINDVDRLGYECPTNLLEEIKRKIILFDSDQTRFIYKDLNKRRITIQGLSGTGKTELLLHKIKDLYTNKKNSRIVLTCHNKILAENLQKRIPDFFNFMKVEEQIDWNTRLWTMNGWGSFNDKNSGVYSYICNYYDLKFHGYSYDNNFDTVCSLALKEFERRENIEPCFDYILIDESQDFPESFFKLCEKVTKEKIYIAGDIFQNIFDRKIISEVSPDFLLNKCYRTDPKTLMFSHAVGMGLFEKPYLRWLTDEEWNACGYIINKDCNNYKISRKKLRRFEDLDIKDIESIKLIADDNKNYSQNIINIIDEIRRENLTVKPDDIGIIFLENIDENYKLASELEILIKHKLGWNVNIGYKSKIHEKGSVFISNRNNVKGLEFPFVICISQKRINDNIQKRNSLYMMLTRSFITTYFLISSKNNSQQLIDLYQDGITKIKNDEELILEEPSDNEKEKLRNAIISNTKVNLSSKDIAEKVMDELNINIDYRDKLHQLVSLMAPNSLDEDIIRTLIDTNYKIM